MHSSKTKHNKYFFFIRFISCTFFPASVLISVAFCVKVKPIATGQPFTSKAFIAVFCLNHFHSFPTSLRYFVTPFQTIAADLPYFLCTETSPDSTENHRMIAFCSAKCSSGMSGPALLRCLLSASKGIVSLIDILFTSSDVFLLFVHKSFYCDYKGHPTSHCFCKGFCS